MKWFTKSDSTVGYLPDETPPILEVVTLRHPAGYCHVPCYDYSSSYH